MSNTSKQQSTIGDPILTLDAYRGLYNHIGRNGRYFVNDFILDVNYAGIEGCIDVSFQDDHNEVCSIRTHGQLEIEYPECENQNLMHSIRMLFYRINNIFG